MVFKHLNFQMFFHLAVTLLYPLHVLGLIQNIQIESESALLINLDNGKILYEKESLKRQYPASITKIATVLYALQRMPDHLDTKIKAQKEAIASIDPLAKIRKNYQSPPYWVETGSSHIGIKLNEELTFRDLLYGMLLESGNDAANVVAQHVGNGSIPHFMDNLNAYLEQIGCSETHFCNPHGLHHPDHYTTALDMAKMSILAMRNPLFCDIVKTVRYDKPATNKQLATVFVQHNQLLRKGKYYYPCAIGVKNGGTKIAKSTLVSAARKKGRTLLAVVLKCPTAKDSFIDSKNLFEAAFNEAMVEKQVLRAGNQAFNKQIPGCTSPLKTYIQAPLSISFYPSEEPVLKCQIQWDHLELPLEKGQKVGLVSLWADGVVVQTIDLLAQESLKGELLHRIGRIFYSNRFFSLEVTGILLLGGGLLFIIQRIFHRRKKQKMQRG